MRGGVNADRDADGPCHDEGYDVEEQRVEQSGPDEPQDRHLVGEGVSEIAPHDVRQPAQVLHMQRLVKAEVGAHAVHSLLRHDGVQADLGEKIARGQLDNDKRHDRDPQQHGDQLEHAPDDVADHGC